MLKKIFISAVLLLAVLSFVVSLLKGKNNEAKVTTPDQVAVITVQGTMLSGVGNSGNIFREAEGVTSGNIMAQIREAAEDDSVKAVVLRINSGGGSATAAEEIGRELLRFKQKTKKPIVASIGDSGASAAYWIAACASDKIYANSTSLTGSIGVYMPYMNTVELFKKIGISSDKIKSGPYKDIMASDREMTPEERAILQNVVNEIYDEFIKTVATGRKMDVNNVRALADGRIYTGSQALKLGLVDELGDYYDALAEAGKLAELPLEDNGLPKVKESPKQQPWEYLLGAEIANAVKTQIVQQLNVSLQSEAAPAAR